MVTNKLKFQLILAELKYIFFKKKYTALIDVTNKCNLRCEHCYQKENLSSEDNTTLEEWEKRFREYRKIGIRYINFVGGEPSLRYEVLQLAENYFPLIDTVTNGQIKIPKEFNHRIVLSLEGLEEEHDQICGKGTFKKAVNNYLGDKRVVIYTVLSKLNYKGPYWFKEFIDFIRKMDVAGFRISFLLLKKGENEGLFLDGKKRREIGSILLEELGRKDSVLLMTKGLINFITSTSLPTKNYKCKKAYFFDAQNKEKPCFAPECNCSMCLSLLKYNPPIYNMKEWFPNRWMIYKTLRKLELRNSHI